VVKTVPAAGTPLGLGSTVVIYTEEMDWSRVSVPDVDKMTVSQARQTMINAGLNIRLTGGAIGNENAVAVEMSIEAGELVLEGAVIDVQFAVNDGFGG
jgi:beta-lactam-binding protein with PASTA domain